MKKLKRNKFFLIAILLFLFSIGSFGNKVVSDKDKNKVTSVIYQLESDTSALNTVGKPVTVIARTSIGQNTTNVLVRNDSVMMSHMDSLFTELNLTAKIWLGLQYDKELKEHRRSEAKLIIWSIMFLLSFTVALASNEKPLLRKAATYSTIIFLTLIFITIPLLISL